MTTWKKMFVEIFKETGDSFDNTTITLSGEEIEQEFDSGYGVTEGNPFTAWSDNFVYFPVCYDGAEWIGYVPRNPNGKATNHHGGG